MHIKKPPVLFFFFGRLKYKLQGFFMQINLSTILGKKKDLKTLIIQWFWVFFAYKNKKLVTSICIKRRRNSPKTGEFIGFSSLLKS